MAERVDAWGENQKAARRNLPLKRARLQRAYRRAAQVELSRGQDADPGPIRRRLLGKWAGHTRQVHLEQQGGRRERLQNEPRRSAEARARRRATRGRRGDA